MTKITELLDSKESLRVMALLPSKNDLAVEQMSLFERFSLICENMYLLENNFLGKSFSELLRKELGLNLSFDVLIGSESQKQIWSALCVPYADKKDICVDVEAKGRFIDTVDLGDCLDVRSYILSSDIKELDKLIAELVNNNSDQIYFDISHVLYLRPDPYHAELAYKNAQSSDIGEDEMSMLISWVICRSLMQKRLDIYLNVGDNVDQAIKFIELLRARAFSASICAVTSISEPAIIEQIACGFFAVSDRNFCFGISHDDENALIAASFYFPLNQIKKVII